LPSNSSDCIVIGGGVIGLSIARRLAQEGLAVTVLERDVCGRGASWAGAGVLAPPNPHRQDAVAALHLRSLGMYPAWCADLHGETGVDPQYDPCGELEIAFDERGLQSLRSDAEAARGRRTADGREAFVLHDAEATLRLVPMVSPSAMGSMECRETAQVRNPRLLRALRASCEKAAVTIRENAAVHSLILEGGRVRGVRTDGEDFAAPIVIVCAGAWTSQIDALREIMPVVPVRGQMLLMKLDTRPFPFVVSRGKTYLVPRRDGHVLLGATEEPEAGFMVRNTPRGIAKLIEKGLRLAPALSGAPLIATWAGLRPGTPDDLPYLGPVPIIPGLIAATGHFRSGLSLAPATAEVVAATVLGRSYDLDLSCCRPGRPMRQPAPAPV
jgi:glycine oxidase